MYTLYAYLTHPLHSVTDVALVGTYDTYQEALDKVGIEMMYYSDEGIQYCVTGEDVDIPSHKLCTYESMIERVSK